MNNSELRERIDTIQENMDIIETQIDKLSPCQDDERMHMIEQSNKLNECLEEYAEQLCSNLEAEAERMLSEAQSLREYHCID